MKNYYKILGVTEYSSVAEIKRAFRKKAKSHHPDLSADKNSQMHLIIEAYRYILQEKKERENFFKGFDFFSQREKGGKFNYRDWLLNRSDYLSRAKLIFFDLFNGNEDAAIEEYYKRKDEARGFNLQNYFNREDFMDCGFVLAEALYYRRDFYESFLLLEKIYYLEKEEEYFRHFFPEVMILINSILRDKLNKFVEDDLALDCYESGLKLNLKKADLANIHRRLSEIYYKFDDLQTAKIHLSEAVRLSPKLAGIKVLQHQLEAL